MAFNRTDRSAVVDIGSNSVRMVAYDRDDRSLEPIFNEKAMSGLGRHLLATGKLDPEGKASALAMLARFRLVAAHMGVGRIRAVATAAARYAADGPAFIEQAEAALGVRIQILSGEEEAQLSALGVICGIPDADGVICDLGGGSLEIADIANRRISAPRSLPLGTLAIDDIKAKRKEAQAIRDFLKQVPAGMAAGRALYLVGGAWRALAKQHFTVKRVPIRIIHQYTLAAEEAHRFAASVGRANLDDSGKLKAISSRRRINAPYSGRLLAQLIARVKPATVVFSAYGLREGVEFDQMSAECQEADPLIAHCRDVGRSGARVAFDGDRLADWAGRAFLTPPGSARLVRAAAWLSDMSGNDHPDYRGHHAAARALHLASAGVNHQERVFLATAVYARYHGYGLEDALADAAKLLDEPARRQATALGMTFRLAHAIEPGDGVGPLPSLRERFQLRRDGQQLALIGDGAPLEALGETVRKRLNQLSKELGVEAAVLSAQSAAA